MADVEAVRRTAGMLESFPRSLLAVSGADRVAYLHNMVTHDIKGLSPGQARPACLLDRQGKIRALLLVHARVDALHLETDPSQSANALEGLRKFIVSEAVEIREITDRHRIVSLHGPSTAALLASVWGRPFPLPTAPLTHREGPPGSGIRWVARWDLFYVPGYHLWVDAEKEAPIRSLLLEKGSSLGLRAIDPASFEILRLEAAVPWPGKEIDETVILNELGMDDLFSATKGCYVGQEIVARIKYRAHPPRLLNGFTLAGDRVPPPRSPSVLEGKPVGILTSACFSPTLHRVIGLGFLSFGVETTDVAVQTPEGFIPAAVADRPFVKPPFTGSG